MTAAEQARKDVEGWLEVTWRQPWPCHPDDVDKLIARLTPVYARAQAKAMTQAAWEKIVHKWGDPEILAARLKEYAAELETYRDERERVAVMGRRFWDAFTFFPGQQSDWQRERAERDALRERAERAEAERNGLETRWRNQLQRAIDAEADVARLREAIEALARAVLKDATTSTNLRVLSRAALASVSPIADTSESGRAATGEEGIITMKSDTVCVRPDCENFGKPLMGCSTVPKKRKP